MVLLAIQWLPLGLSTQHGLLARHASVNDVVDPCGFFLDGVRVKFINDFTNHILYSEIETSTQINNYILNLNIALALQ